jgi:NMD protein affecting ribosome stability and mRNA decay
MACVNATARQRHRSRYALHASPPRLSTAQVCRDCGHVFAPPERRELRQVDGELQEIAVTKRRQQGKATDLEALRELAQQRGYKRGWAERVYQARLAKRHGI